jgi:pSer/pThr/pTyr-binding forkhead associated (FHA) protein
MSGCRGSPSANPKVLLLRRAIPHPKTIFAKVIETIKASDQNDQLRWICHRSSRGQRRYWLLFLVTSSQKTSQIQYLFGLELINNKELALWFFSGFQEPNHLSHAFLEFYEEDKNNPLPRFNLDGSKNLPLDKWIPQALKQELDFAWGFEESEEASRNAKPASAKEQAEVAATARNESRLVTNAIALSEEILKPSGPHLQLIICERGAPRLVQLKEPRSTLGRHPLCQVASPNPTVSARHAIIEIDSDGAQLFDLGSQNGTFLNGHPIPAQCQIRLPEFALLRLGSLYIVYRMSDKVMSNKDDQQFLTNLVSNDRLSLSSLQHSIELARSQGISTSEQLVLEGLLDPEEWVRNKVGSHAFPPDTLAHTLTFSAMIVVLVALASWWYFVSF